MFKSAFTLLLILATSVFAEPINKYHYSLDQSFRTFFVLNLPQIKSDVFNNGGEYTTSFFKQFHIKNENEFILFMKDTFSSSATDFEQITSIEHHFNSLKN